ncbi:MAG: hypothetical protein KME03_18870 [Aphanocapsa lilacina HA4352-LM1]|jgi:hypothetical protein|nr:hypothetical protein [Aphanocapsa lilacina HA4352-LM1]
MPNSHPSSTITPSRRAKCEDPRSSLHKHSTRLAALRRRLFQREARRREHRFQKSDAHLCTQRTYRSWRISTRWLIRGYVADLLNPQGKPFGEPLLCFATPDLAQAHAMRYIDWLMLFASPGAQVSGSGC